MSARTDAIIRRFWREGRNEVPRLLDEALRKHGDISPKELSELLQHAWSAPEFPEAYSGARWWVSLFRRAGFVTDSGRSAPIMPLVVFRGAPWGRRRGMAWSTDRDRAVWFAERWHTSHPIWRRIQGANGAPCRACVFRVTVAPGAVLAMLDDRGEAEIVIDPGMLPPVRRSDIVEPS